MHMGSCMLLCVTSAMTGCGADSATVGTVAASPVGTPTSSLTQLLQWPIPSSVFTTAQRQILPMALPASTPPVLPRDIAQYAQYGYSAWQTGAGTSYPGDLSSNPNPRANPNNPAHDLRTDLLTAYTGSNVARLAHFFTISDVHLADKESPAQGNFLGWMSAFSPPPALNPIAAWSPIVIATVHVLDAAIQTINALHAGLGFDFGMALGDAANNCQYNELRWFIDCVDGKRIVPSSGAHVGDTTMDYQKPFQACGLNPAIPWFVAIGNHDQYWMGAAYEDAKTVAAHVGADVIDMDPLNFTDLAGHGAYMGVVDGTTPFGNVIKAGLDTAMPQPTVVPDVDRRTLEAYTVQADGSIHVTSTTLNFMRAFFETTSSPIGHGFTADRNLADDVAYYSFEPTTKLPLKIIVLNDNPQTSNAASYAMGALDTVQYAWFEAQLAQGQAANQLMFIASHVPVYPQASIADATHTSMWNDPAQEQQLLELVWQYPNAILWLAGHRHVNVVTPQIPSPALHLPSAGFWEVETPSLRDFPQGFRTIELRRNSDGTLSILVTTVNPAVTAGSPAATSRDDSIGAARTFGSYPYTGPESSSSQSYNCELVVPLTPTMQAVFAGLGSAL